MCAFPPTCAGDLVGFGCIQSVMCAAVVSGGTALSWLHPLQGLTFCRGYPERFSGLTDGFSSIATSRQEQ